MGNKMSQKSRKELATQIQPRYLKSGKLEKGRILTEFVENSGDCVSNFHSQGKMTKKREVPIK